MTSPKKIDPNSEEFKAELVKTIEFTDKVVKNFGYEYNPDPGINESIQHGLTRQKLMYGKRYCPCFMVQHTKADRVCPCKPAREEEIPTDGLCHCQIFCTPEYAAKQRMTLEIDQVVHNNSREITSEEAVLLLQKEQLDGAELAALMRAREAGVTDFALIDVRDKTEYDVSRIKGTDVLIPVSDFYNEVEKLEPYKEKPVVFYCMVGNRSSYCQQMLKDMKELGFTQINNFSQGIVGYPGDIEEGKTN